MDKVGQVEQMMDFDPWGQRRDPVDWGSLTQTELQQQFFRNQSLTNSVGTASLTSRGFTGHEMLDEVGIIHMNGRIYDPRLGRFLQADPFVQYPSDTQNYNRYSYVRNNPLNATDPSGYFIFTLGAIALSATGAISGFTAVVATFAFAGFADALVQGASFGQALKAGLISGVSAAAFYGIGEYFSGLEGANQATALEYNLQFLDPTSAYIQAGKVGLTTAQSLGKIAAHGLAGGVMSVISGGKFGHGFASAGLTQAAGGQIGRIGGGSTAAGPTLARIAAASILGGTASKLTGGKFANGAITGAFSRAINDEQHLRQRPLFDDVEASFPAESVSGVGDTIGGKVDLNIDQGNFENACAIRVCAGLNGAGEKIPFIKGETSSGANGDWHIFRVRKLRQYLNATYGPPDIVSRNSADFFGSKGIIIFNKQYSNATGHADLWNGSGCSYNCDFQGATSVELWKLR